MPGYGPAYPLWAAAHEQDEVRKDLARELLEVEARERKLKKTQAELITLVRAGFLVSVGGRRIVAEDIEAPELLKLLHAVLMPEDVARAVELLGGERR